MTNNVARLGGNDKTVLTIEEQINLLISRGLIINDKNKAKEILSDIGYYRLGFYCYHFQDKRTHQFNLGVRLEDILHLYYFDFDFKNLLQKYIYRIEVNFRTQVVYTVSHRYKNNPVWYTDPRVVKNDILKDLNSIYYNIQKNRVLVNHHKKYDCEYAPAWKTFEFLTFGQVYKIFNNLKDDSLKKEIANIYGIRNHNIMCNYLRAIINIRNICSHNAVLYDYNQPFGVSKIFDKYYETKSRKSTNMNVSLRLILFILSKISTNRADELENHLTALFKKGKKQRLTADIIDNIIGFDLDKI